jgi:hypothetical protein
MSTHEAEYAARLESMTAALEREAAESRQALAQALDQRAEAARSGELGRDWQEVQRRVDAGQTTVAAVFTGEDETPEARRLVGLSQRNLAQLGEQLPDELRDELVAAEVEYARIGRGPVPPRLVTDEGGDSAP